MLKLSFRFRSVRRVRRPVGLTLLVAGIVLCILTPRLFARTELNDDLFDVSFPTRAIPAGTEQKMGWASGRWGTVLHTQDGGKTWVRQSSGTDMTLAGICFVDPRYGWAVGDEGTIIHTEDGGESWAPQKSPTPGFLMDVCFVSRHTGWIVTERTTILHTEDGGRNWRIQFSDEDFILKAVSFCDADNGWAVGEFGYTYHTSNGGKDWQHQAGSFDLSDETGEIIGENFLFNVWAINPTTAWVVGMDGHVARTTNAGATWAPITTRVPRTHLFGITSDDAGRLLIVGNAAILTSDFGWRADFNLLAAESRLKYGWLYGVTMNGPGKFVAVGKGGWIYLIDKDQPVRRVTISR